ncbi:protein SCO1/2 [Povalibacter uvarum]|uniref:Protein SCO1/2 n=1 Tax=Povalibacter uvarum TaxID=732238 RepID=A0A841HIY8_9GAMM|nr:SCO family protein [Povalibacter uvarum]MBB6092122.1 protein SCO1/2 [Povalibacter uvarum]
MRTLKRFCLSSLFSLTLGLIAQAAPAEPVSPSLYELDLTLTNQAGASRQFDVYRGHVVLVTMFYGRCPMACPLLIDTLRAIESSIPEAERSNLRVLMVSIDPEHDTPDALAALAKQRRLDSKRWTMARISKDDVRLLAAALNVQYRQLPDGQYNHTSVISLLGPQGAIEKQTTVLGKPDQEFVADVSKALGRGR